MQLVMLSVYVAPVQPAPAASLAGDGVRVAWSTSYGNAWHEVARDIACGPGGGVDPDAGLRGNAAL